jgi:transcriptional regulator with XRE-family HTH domain
MGVDEYQGPPPEGELINAALKRIRPKLSVREAARRAGISEGWWRQVVRGYQPLKGGGKAPMTGSAETVASMARVVGVTPAQLQEAGRADAAEELRALQPPPSLGTPTDAELRASALQPETAEAIIAMRQRFERWVKEGKEGRIQKANRLIEMFDEESDVG